MSHQEDLEAHGRRIKGLDQGIDALYNAQHAQADRLDSLADDIQALAAQLGVAVPAAKADSAERPERSIIQPSDLVAAAGTLPDNIRRQLDDAYLRSAPAIPPLDALDMFVIVSVGCLAALADFLLVGLPPNTKYTPSVQGGQVPVGWLSERLRAWNVSNDNWLASLCKVPFDKSTFPGTDFGFSPVNHRVLSFGHDPSPIGFVFGLMDILSGRITGTTLDGRAFNLESVPVGWTEKALAPLLWLGHLISDVATLMGLPVPGSSLLQLIRVQVPGAPGDATVADVARVLYQQGYDFRHYMASGTVPGLIEGLIRLYDWLRAADEDYRGQRGAIHAHLAERHIKEARGKSRLAARLFWTHAIAAGANAGKVALQGAGTGDFFSAARAINVAQWQLFALRTVEATAAMMRDTSVDQAFENRRRLNERWEELERGTNASPLLYLAPASAERIVL